MSNYSRVLPDIAFSYVANAHNVASPSGTDCSTLSVIDSSAAAGVRAGVVGAGGGSPSVDDQAGAVGPLGTITGFAAILDRAGVASDASVSDKCAAISRIEKFHMLALARGLLPRRRVAHCLRRRIDSGRDVEVFRNADTSRVRAGNVQRCGSPWNCPNCAQVIGEYRRAELSHVLRWADFQGFAVSLFTYTVAHGRSDALQSTLEAVTIAYRNMTRNRAYRALKAHYKLDYTVRATEVTHGEANGWHPHFHVLAIHDPGVVPGELQELLASCWLPELERVGFSASRRRGVRVQSADDGVRDYVAKWGRPWGAADEMTKAHTKHGRQQGRTPFDMLREYGNTRDPRLAGLFREFDSVFHGRHQLQYSRGFRAYTGLADISDDQAAELGEVAPEDELFARVPILGWRALFLFNVVGEFMELARAGDAAAALAFVQEYTRALEANGGRRVLA